MNPISLRFCISMLLLAMSFKTLADVPTETQTQIEEIIIPLSSKNIKANQNVPVRGTFMQSVKQKYGEPQKIHPTKGQPPITRWDYPTFSVYFESSSVIHTVNRAN